MCVFCVSQKLIKSHIWCPKCIPYIPDDDDDDDDDHEQDDNDHDHDDLEQDN